MSFSVLPLRNYVCQYSFNDKHEIIITLGFFIFFLERIIVNFIFWNKTIMLF